MKVIWEEQDIKAGRRIGRAGVIERQIIGYDPAHDGTAKFALISLSDGQIIWRNSSKSELASNITKAGYVPEEMLGEVMRDE